MKKFTLFNIKWHPIRFIFWIFATKTSIEVKSKPLLSCKMQAIKANFSILMKIMLWGSPWLCLLKRGTMTIQREGSHTVPMEVYAAARNGLCPLQKQRHKTGDQKWVARFEIYRDSIIESRPIMRFYFITLTVLEVPSV